MLVSVGILHARTIFLLYKIFFSDIIHGKLDQKNKQLEVDNAIGRDIQPGDVSQIVNTLQEWCDSCETVLACIEEQIRRANCEKQKRIKHKDAVDKEVSYFLFLLFNAFFKLDNKKKFNFFLLPTFFRLEVFFVLHIFSIGKSLNLQLF